MKRFLVLLLTILTLLFSVGCSNSNTSLKTTGVYFDTVISVEIWGSSDESILNKCKELCTYYEQLFSRTIETSDISRINAAKGTPVEVDPETAALIKKGIYYGELSEGTFDISIAPLSILWDINQNTGTLPPQAAIDEAKSHVNHKNILVEGTIVTLTDPNASIDLGGIAKGYIADKLKEYLLGEGIEHGLINLGGNLITIGTKPNGSNFHIGIQKPFDEQNAAITTVDVHNQSVVSSGTYERYFEMDNKIYHHLLNPATGYPYENNLLQVTIISDQSVDGDALSTACFGLGLEKGSALIERLDGVRAIFVTDDYELHYAG